MYACEYCKAEIPVADVNVSTDIALCRACGKTMPFSNIAPLADAGGYDMEHPPKGVRFEANPIHGKSIIYRKIPVSLVFIIPFTMVWSGISMGGIYGTQIAKGEFNLLISLFGIPFLIGTIVLVTTILFGLFGRWRISFNHGVMAVAAEVGPVGWNRRISYDPDTRVSIKTSGWSKNGQAQESIQVAGGGNVLKFGSSIPDEPKRFIAEAVRRSIQGGI